MKDKIINEIIRIEGGYVNHPSDKGGPTKYGITEKVQRKNGYKGDMEELPRDFQYGIYQRDYWDVNKLTEIEKHSQKVQEEVQDTGVNMGVRVAQKFLQEALNALNQQESLYPDIVQDGLIGTKTLSALKDYFNTGTKYRQENQELVLLRVLNSLQGQRYVQIQKDREKNEDFVFGWFLNRVKI